MSNTPVRTTSGGPTRRRPSEFLLPDGRKVLVALPDDIEALRQRYANSHDADPPIQVEVVVHGSDEHREFLQQTRSHHETRRAQLRERHGSVVDEIDAVRTELDAVAAQLHRLEAAAAADGKLNTNFSRFGFDAKLRTYADDDEEAGSGTPAALSRASSTLGGGDSSSVGGYESMRLFRRPVVKQYFHRGLLWRSAEETKVMSFELFFDLLYVGIIAINGDHAAEEANGPGLLRFLITFTMSWKIWADVQQLVSWFETNDILQRVEILFLIACLLGQTNNSLQTFSSQHDTFTQMVGFYLTARLFMAVYCAITAYFLPMVKGMMISQIVNVLVGAALWIASTALAPSVPDEHSTTVVERATYFLRGREAETVAVDENGEIAQNGGRLALVFVALAVDLFGSSVAIGFFRYSLAHTSPFAKKIGSFFEFYPAVNIEHKVERTNAFVGLVFGYSVVGVIFQNAGSFALNSFLGKAILGLTQAFIFNWLYFEVDGDNINMHAIRRRPDWAMAWQFAHLPFVMAYVLAAAALSKLVVATDCVNAPLDALTDFYQHRSSESVSIGLRLYYCVGLGIALLGMAVIALCHEHKVPVALCRLPKWARLANRVAVCVVLCCLPAAGDRLDSLQLVGVTTGLTTWVLLLELWGMSCRSQPFFGIGAQDERCEYVAKCGRRRLEGATKDDGEIDIVELGRGEKTAVTMS
ncbi:hypothetical protein QBC47DRAFT_326288 [Echria macrotheca]|uniref:Low temperature requirement A n=1 Tax=Echria macrotheca TaxID=438768 RepID=A0AAJ0BAH7_9PEZI|nr:hypothetical protein QBC47DRAFT_326288 [Echria macrotheca]